MKKTSLRNSKGAQFRKFAFVLGSAATLIGRAAADTVASFGFETGAGGSSTTSMSPAFAADVGSGTAIGVHASTATVFSTPSGNGSLRSLSSNTFALGDYYQFTIDATNYSGLAVSFDAYSSGTGPKAFTLQYSANGGAFSTFASYTIAVSVPNTGTATGSQTTFSTGASNSNYNYAFALTGISALNSTTDVFRLVENDTTTATAGTSRVDNFLVTGTAGTATPEPSSMLLLSVAGAGAAMAMRRRKSS